MDQIREAGGGERARWREGGRDREVEREWEGGRGRGRVGEWGREREDEREGGKEGEKERGRNLSLLYII